MKPGEPWRVLKAGAGMGHVPEGLLAFLVLIF